MITYLESRYRNKEIDRKLRNELCYDIADALHKNIPIPRWLFDVYVSVIYGYMVNMHIRIPEDLESIMMKLLDQHEPDDSQYDYLQTDSAIKKCMDKGYSIGCYWILLSTKITESTLIELAKYKHLSKNTIRFAMQSELDSVRIAYLERFAFNLDLLCKIHSFEFMKTFIDDDGEFHLYFINKIKQLESRDRFNAVVLFGLCEKIPIVFHTIDSKIISNWEDTLTQTTEYDVNIRTTFINTVIFLWNNKVHIPNSVIDLLRMILFDKCKIDAFDPSSYITWSSLIISKYLNIVRIIEAMCTCNDYWPDELKSGNLLLSWILHSKNNNFQKIKLVIDNNIPITKEHLIITLKNNSLQTACLMNCVCFSDDEMIDVIMTKYSNDAQISLAKLKKSKILISTLINL